MPLDLVHSPDCELGEKIARRVHRRFNSHRQFLNRFERGLTELIRSSFAHPPLEGFTDSSAGQPQFDIVRFVHQRLLHTLASNRPR